MSYIEINCSDAHSRGIIPLTKLYAKSLQNQVKSYFKSIINKTAIDQVKD